jgi:hypothetical protein
MDKSRWEVKFQEGDEVWLNIKNFQLPKNLNHKFLGPYVDPFKVLEKKIFNTDKLKLPKNLRVHPTFHVSFLKSVAHDASRPNREHNSRPPPDLVHNELKFEVEAMLKSRQLRGREREYLVKWKGYHLIEAFWVNESDMEHAQEAIEEFHTRSVKKRRRTWWGHHLSLSGARSHIKCTTSWCAPKFLVRPKKGPTMLKNGSSWNLVLLPVSSTKGGERGVLKASGLD